MLVNENDFFCKLSDEKAVVDFIEENITLDSFSRALISPSSNETKEDITLASKSATFKNAKIIATDKKTVLTELKDVELVITDVGVVAIGGKIKNYHKPNHDPVGFTIATENRTELILFKPEYNLGWNCGQGWLSFNWVGEYDKDLYEIAKRTWITITASKYSRC